MPSDGTPIITVGGKQESPWQQVTGDTPPKVPPQRPLVTARQQATAVLPDPQTVHRFEPTSSNK